MSYTARMLEQAADNADIALAALRAGMGAPPGGVDDADSDMAAVKLRLMDRAKQAAALAHEAFADNDAVTGIAAITIASQLVALARLW